MDPSSSGGQSGRPRQNRSRGGRNRNQNRNRNRDRNQNQDRNRGGQSSRRPQRDREDDIMRERFPRPEPKPSLLQRILGFFGIGGDPKKTQPSKGTSSGSASRKGGGDERSRSKSDSSGKSGGEKRERKPRQKRPVEKVEVTSGRLYVGNLDYGVTGEDLNQLFQEVGTVVKAEIVIHNRSGKSKGFAFVEMATTEEARQAVEKFHDHDFKGRQMLVCGAKSDGQRDESEESGGGGGGGESGERPRRERKPRGERREREERGSGSGGRNRKKADFGDEESDAPRKPKAPAEKVSGTKLSIGNLSDGVTATDVREGIEDIAKLTAIGDVSGGSVVVEFASVDDAQRALDVLTGKTFMGQMLKVSGASDDESVTAVSQASAPVESPRDEESPGESTMSGEESTPTAEAESFSETDTEPEPVVDPPAEAPQESVPEAPAETPVAVEEEVPAASSEAVEETPEEKPAEPQA
ncbi:MAG: hypothetical protein KDN19_03480 [Verrucomicrobiae bacterium]|nr:hypothetical protein [Verrucomicrobiae bacterium]